MRVPEISDVAVMEPEILVCPLLIAKTWLDVSGFPLSAVTICTCRSVLLCASLLEVPDRDPEHYSAGWPVDGGA
ncbi:hypothetical protein Tco_0485307 [Tanacetum coccineum]